MDFDANKEFANRHVMLTNRNVQKSTQARLADVCEVAGYSQFPFAHFAL